MALISVGDENRWQLPKGIIDKGESAEEAALREMREEAGIETETVGFLEKAEYWYYSRDRGERVRFHKFVHFYLLRYKSGDVGDHDHEVNEARWVEINQAREILAFKGEKEIIERAQAALCSSP